MTTIPVEVGHIVVVHAPADHIVPYDCYYSGPVVEIRPGGLYVVEPVHFKPMPEKWRPYDGVKQIFAMKLDPSTGTNQLTWVATP